MGDTKVQIPSLVLPASADWPLTYYLGNETEALTDLLEHTSDDFPIDYIQEKIVHIYAVEIVAAGTPGNLWCWIELSPFPSTTSAVYWAALGGGGGGLTPIMPYIEVATGTNLTVHTITLPWTNHSQFGRVVVQTPVSADLATAYWVVQAWISGKSE